MFSSIATESLTQRGESPLFKDLIALHEKAKRVLGTTRSDEDIIKVLTSMNYQTALTNIVKTRMGVTLQSVSLYQDKEVNAKISMNQTLLINRAARHKQATRGMMMETVNKLYNNKKAYLSAPTDPLPISFLLLISTKWWTFANPDGSLVFTPREIVAILLHELGHADHFIKSIGRVYGRLTDSAEVVTYLQTTQDKETVLGVLTIIKKSPFLNPAWLPILNATEQYFKTTNSFDDPVYWEALTSLSTMIAAESAQRIATEITKTLGDGRDQVSTHVHKVEVERQADEFASRNGAYGDLASALSKSQTLAEQWKTSTLLPGFFQSTLGYFYHLFNIKAESIAFGYDPIMRRMELFLETAKHAFHDEHLPIGAKQEITEQILLAEQIVADYHSVSHRAYRAKIKAWMDNVSTFGRIFASPFQDRLTGDYGRLQEASRSLSRHPLYYMADR